MESYIIAFLCSVILSFSHYQSEECIKTDQIIRDLDNLQIPIQEIIDKDSDSVRGVCYVYIKMNKYCKIIDYKIELIIMADSIDKEYFRYYPLGERESTIDSFDLALGRNIKINIDNDSCINTRSMISNTYKAISRRIDTLHVDWVDSTCAKDKVYLSIPFKLR